MWYVFFECICFCERPSTFSPCKACRNIIQLEKCSSQAHIDFCVSQIVLALAEQVQGSSSIQLLLFLCVYNIWFLLSLGIVVGAVCCGSWEAPREITMDISIMCARQNWIDFFNNFLGYVALNFPFASFLVVNLLYTQVGWQNLATGSSW